MVLNYAVSHKKPQSRPAFLPREKRQEDPLFVPPVYPWSVVRYIYRLYLKDGLGIRRIARRLNEEDFHTRRGGLWGMIERPRKDGNAADG